VVIDIHCHTAGLGDGESGCTVAPRLRCNWRYAAYLRAFGVTAADLARGDDALVLDRIAARLESSRRIDAAVVLALDGVVGPDGALDAGRTEVMVPGEFVARATARHPRLLYGASVHPHRRDALERLEQAAAEGAVLLKWLPAIQSIDPAERRFVPFYRTLATLGLPLLVHVGSEHSFTGADAALGDPQRLRLPLDEGVTVIAAHAAAGGRSDGEPNLERLARLARAFPNLYADVSALTQLNRLRQLPRVLARSELEGRLLYGSDFPLLTTLLVSPWYFVHRLGVRRAAELDRISNPWDRDVALKEALGLPADALTRAASLLRLPAGWGLSR
jgi:hypothetical protein